MSKITIENNLCKIDDELDFLFLKRLDDELSFKVQGAEHTKAYQGYYKNGTFVKWDGIKRILTRQLTFPRGLLQRVINFYSSNNKEVIIEDLRHKKELSFDSISILYKLKELGKEPYPYQIDVLNAAIKTDSGIIRAATGSGKSLMFALLTAHFNKKSIIYVTGKDLLYQMHKLYSQIFSQEIGIIGDGHCTIKDINIASIWTIGQALGMKKDSIVLDREDDGESLIEVEKYKDILFLMKEARFHGFDEIHLAGCETVQEIYRNINPEYIYGMSASPWREDGGDMLIESLFGPTIIDISASKLIREGYLVRPTIRFLNVPKYHEKLPKKYPTVYKHYIIENEIRNNLIIKGSQKLVEQGYKTLVLYSKLNHGKILFEEISKQIPSVLLSGKSSADERLKAKEDIEKGDISCIVASTIFDIGVDIPCLSALINASAGKSSVRALQRIGRVIRSFPNKTNAAVLEFQDNAHYVKQHSQTRKSIYLTEEEFIIECR